MNVVINRRPTKILRDVTAAAGVATGRDVLIDALPGSISVPRSTWTTICALSSLLCAVGLTQGPKTVMSWLKADIRNRSDFWEALNHAGRTDRCFAWTFVPSRNFTHKGSGTSGCKLGTNP